MLFLTSEFAAKNLNTIDVAREFSLIPGRFSEALGLDRQLAGKLRRIVLLTKRDISAGTVAVLNKAAKKAPLGLVVCVDREALRLRNQDYLIDELAPIPNIQWLRPKFSSDELLTAVRNSRQALLQVPELELASAMVNREFSLRYQPKVVRGDGQEWKTAEVEALLRWEHPTRGNVSPMDFLPELEAFGMMRATSEFVLHEAAAQLIRWRQGGLDLNSCINLASSQLNQPKLPDRYEAIVKERGLECSNFTFEIVEHNLADTDAPHLQVVKQLRERGFRISLDHFGIAAASLGKLIELPVDEIKIHSAALKRARQDDVAQKMLAAVTGLAHNLGISVCAEGVEDQETYDFLEKIECDKLQGYLISEAVMPDLIQSGYSAESIDIHAVA